MSNPIDRILDALRTYTSHGGSYRSACPAHRGDNPTALKITEVEDGAVWLYCHAHQCTPEAIMHALGLDPRERFPEGHPGRTGKTPRHGWNWRGGKFQAKPRVEIEMEKTAIEQATHALMRLLYPVDPQPFDISETPLEPLAPYCAVLETCWEAYGEEANYLAAQAQWTALVPELQRTAPNLLYAVNRSIHAYKKQHPEAETAAPIIRGKKLADLLKKTFTPVSPVVDQVLMPGTTLFAGKPKIGKSRALLALAVAVASGGKALGRLPVSAGPVLFLSLEDPERRLQARAIALLEDADAPDQFEYETDWPRLDQGGLQAFKDWLDAHPGARLVVIDTFARIRPKPQGPEHSYLDDYRSLQGLTDLCAQYDGLAIIINHHTNKQKDAEDVADLISGTTGLPGTVDGFAIMRKRRGEHDATLTVVHRDLLEDQHHALCSDPLTGGWTFEGAADMQPTSPEQREILDALAHASVPQTAKWLAESLGKAPGAIRFLLWRLWQEGRIARSATGRYTLPSASSLSPTNTTNTANSTNTTNTANSPEEAPQKSVSGVSGRVKPPLTLFPQSGQGLEPSVSGVSGNENADDSETSGAPMPDYACSMCGQRAWWWQAIARKWLCGTCHPRAGGVRESGAAYG